MTAFVASDTQVEGRADRGAMINDDGIPLDMDGFVSAGTLVLVNIAVRLLT